MDPVQWREEAERVVSKLKNGVTQNRLAENWGDHLTVLRNYVKENDFIRHDNNRKLSNNDIDQNNMSIDQIKNKKSIVEDNEICIKNENRSAILLSINHLKLTLSNQLGAINRSEKILNSTQKYHILSAEYENNKKVTFFMDFFQAEICVFFVLNATFNKWKCLQTLYFTVPCTILSYLITELHKYYFKDLQLRSNLMNLHLIYLTGH